MIPKCWIDLSPEDQSEIYKSIDEANADYMKAISAPTPKFGHWYSYVNEHGCGIKRDVIGYGVTTKRWSPL